MYRKITRIFLKVFLGWLIILTIFLYNLKEVNFSVQPKTDLVIDNKKNKLSSNKTNNKKSKLRQKVEKKINIKKINKEKEEYLINVVNEALYNKHYSANKYKVYYKKLCSYYLSYCKKIDLDSEFTDKEKTYYTAITIYFIKYLKKVFPNVDNKIYYIKLQREKKGRRGYAGHHSLVMNIKKNMSYMDFFEVLTHEMGHLVDLGLITGNSWFKDKTYTEFGRVVFKKDDKSLNFYKLSWKSEKIKNPYVYTKDFVSGYALTDPFEDFAESFNMYVNHNSVFIQMGKESNILKQKYNFFNKIMKGKYLRSDKKFNYRYKFRPRDTTKMK